MKCKKDDGVEVCGEDAKIGLAGFLMEKQDSECLMVMDEVMKREDLTEVTDSECGCLTKYDVAEVEAGAGFMIDSCGLDGKESLKNRKMKCKDKPDCMDMDDMIIEGFMTYNMEV